MNVVVDLALLDDLLEHDLVLLLELLVGLTLALQLVLRNGLGPVELGLLGGDLQVHAVQLLDLLLLLDTLLAQLDACLLGHAHVVDDVLPTPTLLRQLGVVFVNQRCLVGVLLLKRLHILCLSFDEVSELGHLKLLLLYDVLVDSDALSGVLLRQLEVLLVLSTQIFHLTRHLVPQGEVLLPERLRYRAKLRDLLPF